MAHHPSLCRAEVGLGGKKVRVKVRVRGRRELPILAFCHLSGSYPALNLNFAFYLTLSSFRNRAGEIDQVRRRKNDKNAPTLFEGSPL